MSWKKNLFGNLMWAVYTLFVLAALWGLVGEMSAAFGIPFTGGAAAALALAGVAAGCAFLLHRIPAGSLPSSDSSRLAFLEALLAVAFLVAGLMLRMAGLSGAGEGGAYYQAAMVAEGQALPVPVHGAVWLYLQLLHNVFLFLGNKLIAGIWLQVILQLAAALLLYLAVRKLAGVFPALALLCFFSCMGPVVESALALSPEPLYLLIIAIGIDLFAACAGGRGAFPLFLAAGLWAGLAGYLDISGFLLLIPGAAVAMKGRRGTARPGVGGLVFCAAGTLAGFFGAILADAFISGKGFGRVLGAWWNLYRPGEFGSAAFAAGKGAGLVWGSLLLFLLSLGVFSCRPGREKENMGAWTLFCCAALAAQYCGVTTEEIPAAMYLLIGLTVLGGVGLRNCFRERTEGAEAEASEGSAEAETEMAVDGEEMVGTEAEAAVDGVEAEAEMAVDDAETAGAEAEAAVDGAEAEAEMAVDGTETAGTEAEASEGGAEAEAEMAVDGEKTVGTEAKAAVGNVKAEAEAAVKETGAVSAQKNKHAREEEPEEGSGTVTDETKAGKPAGPEEKTGTAAENAAGQKPRYIENPLPMPKPHRKKEMGYLIEPSGGADDYDYPVDENDDFDIQ